jgi:hypothetical protein
VLNSYIAQIQRFCRDQKQQYLDIGNLTDYVNRARREVAMRAQCVRILTPISGSVISCSLTSGGSNYSSSAQAVITAPDFPSGFAPKPNGDQATASLTIQGGAITAVDIDYGGYGYYQPQISFMDTTGSGAAGTLAVSPINVMTQGMEGYPFSSIDLSASPGAGSIYAVISVAVLYANWRYTLACPSFSSYQAALRSFPFQYQYVPFYCAQYGRGSSGMFMLYPQPSAAWQMEWDCLVLPQDLTDNQSYEIIPQPFTDAVPFLSAYYAFLELQNMNAARFYEDAFNKWMNRYAIATLPGRVGNPYGRRYW